VSTSSGGIVLVTGASGFIGKVVVAALAERGFRVRALTRNPLAWPLPSRPDTEVVPGDLRDAASLIRAVSGATAVVHLAAATADEPDSDDVNVAGAERLVAACRAAGCTRLIDVSTQSAKIARKGVYARTKARADAVFRASGLRVTTLLPSIVYGEEPSGVFGTVSRFVRTLPVLPILGDGRWRSAPVYVGDVAHAIACCLASDDTIGKSYDIAGPDLLSFDELADRLAAAFGVRIRKVHVPFGLSLLTARVASAVLPRSPITVSNVLGSNQDTSIDIGPARRDFGFDPLDLDRGLAIVLGAREATGAMSLAGECRLFARYLLDVDPPDLLIERYVAAHQRLLGGPEASPSCRELRFVHRHPRALPFVDAALGLRDRQSVLRKKILLTAAILEASPLYADFFLERSVDPLRTFLALSWCGFTSAAKLPIGIPLLLLARLRG
jgi:NADH dehydrogenase